MTTRTGRPDGDDFEIPDSLDDATPILELGGTIARTASIECKQGAHDLCVDETCRCRHHEFGQPNG